MPRCAALALSMRRERGEVLFHAQDLLIDAVPGHAGVQHDDGPGGRGRFWGRLRFAWQSVCILLTAACAL